MHSLIFFGSDQYSAVALTTLLNAKIELQIVVVTDQPKPVGKGLVVTPSPVEILAKTHNLKVSYYPDFDHSLITKDTLGLCASFDHLVPAEIIDLFAGHLYNLHPSLLPQYRNVSPVQYAILMGDTVTGITLFRISTGIDNGQIISQTEETISPTDSSPTLTPRLFEKGANLFLEYLNNPKKLDGLDKLDGPTTHPLIFTHRLTRDSGYIEWPTLSKLLANKPITLNESQNELLLLRLNKINSSGLEFGAWNLVLSDLLRSLTPWPGIWSNAPTKKGDLRLSLESVTPEITVKLAGKPKAISYSDFAKYYL